MAKPLTPAKLKKIDAIADDIARSSKQTGKPMPVNQTPTFQAISRKGTKIQIARAFSKAVNSGEIQGIKVAGRTKANHVLYSTSGGAGGTAASANATIKKGFLARLFGG